MNKKQKAEAVSRMEELSKKLHLSPIILSELKHNNRTYSQVEADHTKIYLANNSPELVELINHFENENNAYVYHILCDNSLLIFLYVSDNEEDWEFERFCNEGYVSAYVYNLIYPMCSEFGDILITQQNGAIIRIL